MSAHKRFVGCLRVGDRVLTPTGQVARVEGLGEWSDGRVSLLYGTVPADASPSVRQEHSVVLHPRLLRPYDGEPVAWPDEIARLQRRAALDFDGGRA
jgi:hypothetical protein